MINIPYVNMPEKGLQTFYYKDLERLISRTYNRKYTIDDGHPVTCKYRWSAEYDDEFNKTPEVVLNWSKGLSDEKPALMWLLLDMRFTKNILTKNGIFLSMVPLKKLSGVINNENNALFKV